MDNKLDKIPTKLLLTLVFLLLASIVFLLRLRQKPQTVEASWWNELWHYRNYITVTNNTSQEYNVYTTLSVGTSALIASGKMQSDCGDLRFTNSFGNLLDYYIVSGCNTSSTSININHTTLSPGVQFVYFYYGNSIASNGTQASNFSTQATNYTVGSTSTEEKGTAPIAYWNCNEGTGVTVHDIISGSHGNFGTGGSVPSWTSDGKINQGLSFDGTNSLVDVPSIPTNLKLLTTSTFSISAWVNPTTLSGTTYYPIVANQRNTSLFFGLYGNTPRLGLDDGFMASTATINTDEWSHVVVVYDGGTTQATFYVNGQQYNTVKNTDILSGTYTNLYIGYESRFGERFSGIIDEVKVFDYVLTGNQVKVEYNYGAGTIIGSNKVGITEPLVYWKLDENYGTTLNNSGSLGSPQNATLGPGDSAPTWTFGRQKQALLFDGTNDYASTPTSSSLDITASGLTYSAWINGNDFSGKSYNMIMGRYLPYFSVRSTGKLFFSFHDGAQKSITSDTTLQTGVWYYVVATYDSSGYVSLYVNGKLDKSAGPYSTPLTNYNHRFSIGTWQNAGTNFFNGYIDEVKVYNYPLSPEQITINYNLGSAMSIGTSQSSIDVGNTNLVGWWKMDEGVGTTAYDAAGGNHHGLFTNMDSSSWIPGIIGKALSFNGSNQYVNASSVGNAKSVSFWLNASDVSGRHGLIQFGSSIYSGIEDGSIKIAGITSPRLYVNGILQEAEAVHITSSRWYHVAIVSDTNFNVSSLYLGYTSSTLDYFSGLLDNVRLISQALTPSQVAWEYNQGAPFLHWRFDEDGGTTAYDSVGTYNGVIANSPAWVDGVTGKALNFNGSTQNVTASIPNTNYTSISIWVYPTTSAASKTIVTASKLTTDSSSRPVFGSCTGTALPLDTWTHIVAVSDPTADECTIYQNGVLSSNIGASVTFGTSVNVAADSFSGYIDDVRFFSYPLTPDQIKNLYNGGSAIKFN